jgi:hypothetical protein
MKIKIEDTSKVKEELEFVPIDTPPCSTCKNKKEDNVKFQNWTKDEMDFAMTIIDKHNLTREQKQWLVNLNNRVLNDRKTLACGKCFTQVLRNLRNAYNRLYGG